MKFDMSFIAGIAIGLVGGYLASKITGKVIKTALIVVIIAAAAYLYLKKT